MNIQPFLHTSIKPLLLCCFLSIFVFAYLFFRLFFFYILFYVGKLAALFRICPAYGYKLACLYHRIHCLFNLSREESTKNTCMSLITGQPFTGYLLFVNLAHATRSCTFHYPLSLAN